MQLKSLEINGFKSFAKKGALSFNSSITSIVGPNGSGKSNVAESFRFVLGEQSIKSMRGKKGEDLIFNGGKDTPRANRASVKLVFDNTKRFFNLDVDEVTLERAVHRDGVNEYSINGTQVRLKDVAELLAHANIGSSGHHIISQGEADRLLSAVPLERREMIEDALGLKVYQYKKEESEKKLAKTADHMKEVESLRREIAPHIKFLKKQVEKIERALAMRQELVGLYKDYFAKEDAYIKAEKARLGSERKEPSIELDRLQKELAEHKATLAKAEAESRGADGAGKGGKSTELFNLDKTIRDTRAKKDQLTRELGRLEGELSYIKRAIEKKAREDAQSNQKQILLSEVEKLESSVKARIVRAQGAQSVEELQIALKEIGEMFGQFISLNKNGVAGEGATAGAGRDEQEEIERIAKETAKIQGDLSQLVAEEKSQADDYARIKAEIDSEKDKNVESEKSILKIMSRQSELHGVLGSIKAQLDRVAVDEEAFTQELTQAAFLVGREAIAFEVVLLAGEDRAVQVERRRNIEKIKIRLEEAGGAGGDDVLKEYRDAEERDAFLSRELTDLQTSSDSLQALIDELTGKLDVLFKEGIRKINKEFETFFRLMFGGGEARLDVVKEEKKKRRKAGAMEEDGDEEGMTAVGPEVEDDEELQEGIDIYVALPHKRTKGLMMLSGGERALTSIALLFAMSQVNPPPFIILDETDAALDEANSRKYGDMIESLSKHSQLILITHNRETMSRAGVIYGVTMGMDGASKLLSIAFDDAVAVAK